MAHVSFAQNRRTRGLYQSASPSRFIDELPVANVEVAEVRTPFGSTSAGFGRQNPYGAGRFDETPAPFRSSYETPGWQRAKQNFENQAKPAAAQKWASAKDQRRAAPTIEGRLIASQIEEANFAVGERVAHAKFGGGTVLEVSGTTLTIHFDNGEKKRLVASYVERE